MNEIWKGIPEYEDSYKVSNLGRVRSLDRVSYHPYSGPRRLKGKILSPKKCRSLLYVDLYTVPNSRKIGVHQAVLLTFVGKCPEGMEVCHEDGNAHNNKLENLRYDTHTNNELDKIKHGTKTFKPVIREDGMEFCSMIDAAKSIKTSPSNISMAVRRHYRAGGFRWSLKEVTDN